MIQKEVAHRMIDELFEFRETMRAKGIPQEATQHFQQMKKEGLLGTQALLSHSIHKMDTRQENQESSMMKIKVED
ncbi:hypothetical protein MKY41_03635 [Sporosarcina sp. FSL W7-1349]|uniref:hypothetical protein n=1 Tax=Sporosarcina sp. FSL W7-1349 TaxID=2921561 RepID=UPI0030F8759C